MSSHRIFVWVVGAHGTELKVIVFFLLALSGNFISGFVNFDFVWSTYYMHSWKQVKKFKGPSITVMTAATGTLASIMEGIVLSTEYKIAG